MLSFKSHKPVGETIFHMSKKIKKNLSSKLRNRFGNFDHERSGIERV